MKDAEMKHTVYTAQETKFSIKDFFSKCDQIRRNADLVAFTKEILNGKLPFLCCVSSLIPPVWKLIQRSDKTIIRREATERSSRNQKKAQT